MPIPKPNFEPPFNIIRCSHARLTGGDLAASRALYEGILGLNVTDEDSSALYLRGMEERQHHSLVIEKSSTPGLCRRLAFKLGSEEDLDKAQTHFADRGLEATWAELPYQGRTLLVTDPWGSRLEFYFKMDQASPIMQKYGFYKGAHPLRIDHFNCFASDVQGSVDFYNDIGFRTTEYTETDGADGKVWAAWMHRKGGVHDIAFTNGAGPRMHHTAYFVPSAMNIIHLCDVMATTGYLASMERGPGRHGISNAFFLYIRDPDGHRIEIYASDYLTVDPDLEPIRWSLSDTQRQTLWGTPAPKSWFEEGSPFEGTDVTAPILTAQPIIAH
jgi:catechol 2,3-dioxygenase